MKRHGVVTSMGVADQQHLAWVARSFGRPDYLPLATDDVELSQAAIATLLAASRQSMNESIARLKQLGAVETGYRRIDVIDRPTVAEVAAKHRA